MKNNLKEKRLEHHLTQYEVANKLGFDEATYRRYERGKMIPNVNRAIELSKLMRTPVEKLFPMQFTTAKAPNKAKGGIKR